MNCDRACRLFVTEPAATYAGARPARLSRHLAVCASCRETARDLERDRRLIVAAFEFLPLRPDFTQVVMARIRRKT